MLTASRPSEGRGPLPRGHCFSDKCPPLQGYKKGQLILLIWPQFSWKPKPYLVHWPMTHTHTGSRGLRDFVGGRYWDGGLGCIPLFSLTSGSVQVLRGARKVRPCIAPARGTLLGILLLASPLEWQLKECLCKLMQEEKGQVGMSHAQVGIEFSWVIRGQWEVYMHLP